MAKKNYLVNIDLNNNELQNAVIHNVNVLPTLTSADLVDVGKIIYLVPTNTAYILNNIEGVATWEPISKGDGMLDYATTAWVDDYFVRKEDFIVPEPSLKITFSGANNQYFVDENTPLNVVVEALINGIVFLPAFNVDKVFQFQIIGTHQVEIYGNIYSNGTTVFASYDIDSQDWIVTSTATTETPVIPNYRDVTVDKMYTTGIMSLVSGVRHRLLYTLGALPSNTLLLYANPAYKSLNGLYVVLFSNQNGSVITCDKLAGYDALNTVRVKNGKVYLCEYNGNEEHTVEFLAIEDADTQLGIDRTLTSSRDFLNRKGDFVMLEQAVGGYANNLYLDDADSDVDGYKTLTYNPSLSESIHEHTIQSSDGVKVIDNYLFPVPVGVEIYPAGLWSFFFFGRVNNSNGVTELGVTYFRRLTNGAEIDMFTVWSGDINNTDNEWMHFTPFHQPSFVINSSDRMGLRVLLRTTSTATRTIYIYIGDGYGSYYNTPNAIRHSQLRALNGDSEFQHVDVTDIKTKVSSLDKVAILDDADDKMKMATMIDVSPVEALDEGNGVGYRLRNTNPANYGNIGDGAIDLSISTGLSSTKGATGANSFVIGEDNIAAKQGSSAFGWMNFNNAPFSHVEGEFNINTGRSAHVEGVDNSNEGINAHVEGESNINSGVAAHVEGASNFARSRGEHSGGEYGTDYTPTGTSTDRLVNYGNGTSSSNRKNAFTVFKNGLATLPSVTNELIDGNAKSIITKEWALANLPRNVDPIFKGTNLTLSNFLPDRVPTLRRGYGLTINGYGFTPVEPIPFFMNAQMMPVESGYEKKVFIFETNQDDDDNERSHGFMLKTATNNLEIVVPNNEDPDYLATITSTAPLRIESPWLEVADNVYGSNGKKLSSNDYTTTEKNKLAGIQVGAQVNTVTSVAGRTGAVVLNKSDVGLGNADNTSDLNKPISTATQTALNGKAAKTIQVTNITLTQGSWTYSSGLWRYDISNANITALKIVEVIPANESIDIVQSAFILPANESFAGYVRVYSKLQPQGNIIVTLNISE